MLISKLVSQSGISKETIRFYEREGLIKITNEDRRKNNYKEYSKEILEKLIVIKRLKDCGFTLDKVAEICDLIESNEETRNNLYDKISENIELLDQKIKEMNEVRSLLRTGSKYKDCCNTPKDGN